MKKVNPWPLSQTEKQHKKGDIGSPCTKNKILTFLPNYEIFS